MNFSIIGLIYLIGQVWVKLTRDPSTVSQLYHETPPTCSLYLYIVPQK